MTNNNRNDNRPPQAPAPGSLPEPMNEEEQSRAEIETVGRAALEDWPVAVDPETADAMGAFEEVALSETDADDSRFDTDPETGLVLEEVLPEETTGPGDAA